LTSGRALADDDSLALRASVLIVEYATRPFLGACLDALEKSALPRDQFEVIVVDNASPTPLTDFATRYRRVRFITSRRNLGFAGGNVLALGYATGDFVVLLNPDACPAPDWLPAILRPFADPKVGVVGSKILHPRSDVLQHAGGVLFPNGLSQHRGRGQHDAGQWDQASEVDYVCGAALAIRREVIERVGFLSPAYHPAYYEETELCVRAKKAGFKVVYAPDAVVEHHESVASGGPKADAYLARFHTSRLRFILRNYSKKQLFTRFLPAELAWLERSCPPAERRICFAAYLEAWRTARDESRGAPRADDVARDSFGSGR
jgi:GT2 family glycosyltransferase